MLLLAAATSAKEISIYPRQDVYVERERPTWSYRTAVLQVGKDGASSEYRAFVAFDLSGLAAAIRSPPPAGIRTCGLDTGRSTFRTSTMTHA